jgi:polysaccharide biosynthesis protein PslG
VKSYYLASVLAVLVFYSQSPAHAQTNFVINSQFEEGLGFWEKMNASDGVFQANIVKRNELNHTNSCKLAIGSERVSSQFSGIQQVVKNLRPGQLYQAIIRSQGSKVGVAYFGSIINKNERVYFPQGEYKWREDRIVFEVPLGQNSWELSVVLENQTGSLMIDDIRVSLLPVKNGDFEELPGLSGWSICGDNEAKVSAELESTLSYKGTKCVKLLRDKDGKEGVSAGIKQTLCGLQPGVTYRLRMFVKGIGVRGAKVTHGEGGSLELPQGNYEWRAFSWYITPEWFKLDLNILLGDTTSALYVDDVELEPVSTMSILDVATLPANLILNPSFENSSDSSWNLRSVDGGNFNLVTSENLTGSRCAQLVTKKASNEATVVLQTINGLKPNTNYGLMGWFKGKNIEMASLSAGATHDRLYLPLGNYEDWQMRRLIFKTGHDERSAEISISASGDNAELLIDNCSLLEISKPAHWNLMNQEPITNGRGVNVHFYDKEILPQSGEFEKISLAGFKWIRMELRWSDVEKKVGYYDFSFYDSVAQECEKNKIKIMFILGSKNTLYDFNELPKSSGAIEAFANYALAAAKHFKDRGYYWEVSNEPNQDQFYGRMPEVYVKLLIEVGKKFKANLPRECLIGPALAGCDLDFLRLCLEKGALNYLHGITFHPYRPSKPEDSRANFQWARELIFDFAPDRDVPLMMGECGYSLTDIKSEDLQAKYFMRQYLASAALEGCTLGNIWYCWRDGGIDKNEKEHHFGMLRYDYSLKKSYAVSAAMGKFLDGYHFEKRETLKSKDDYLLKFYDKNKTTWVVWTTSEKAEGKKVYLNLPEGDYSVVDFEGNENFDPLQFRKGETTMLTITDAPLYLICKQNK